MKIKFLFLFLIALFFSIQDIYAVKNITLYLDPVIGLPVSATVLAFSALGSYSSWKSKPKGNLRYAGTICSRIINGLAVTGSVVVIGKSIYDFVKN